MTWRYHTTRELSPALNQQFQALAAELSERGAVLFGDGSPEGRYGAQRGVLYQQQDPAGPGLLWIKTTPSGNTGWQQVV